MKSISSIFNLVISCLIAMLITSCSNSKKLRIFTELQNDSSSQIVIQPANNLIKPGNILYISVFGLDAELSKSFTIATSSTSGATPGFLVNDSGIIKIPVLGNIQCAHMTKLNLEDTIKKFLLVNKFIIDPIVTVRIANYKITVLGEVNNPGVINVPNESVNIIDAIGLAGDFGNFANRKNILLIREIDGKRIYKRFDMNDPELFSKDFFNLQNNDVLYIEPMKSKISSVDRSNQTYSLILSTLTIIVLVYSQIVTK